MHLSGEQQKISNDIFDAAIAWSDIISSRDSVPPECLKIPKYIQDAQTAVKVNSFRVALFNLYQAETAMQLADLSSSDINQKMEATIGSVKNIVERERHQNTPDPLNIAVDVMSANLLWDATAGHHQGNKYQILNEYTGVPEFARNANVSLLKHDYQGASLQLSHLKEAMALAKRETTFSNPSAEYYVDSAQRGVDSLIRATTFAARFT